MTQQEFYELPEVQQQLGIQKVNRHGSKEHRAAFYKIGEIAKKYGVFGEYSAAGGGKDYD